MSTDSCRMLKKVASVVLASLRGSTYRTKYASPRRSLRPCRTPFLSILRASWHISESRFHERRRLDYKP